MAVEKGDEVKREDCEEESEENVEENGSEWTQRLEELGEIIDVFEVNRLQGKTVLDVGTYGIKPLYIALKYEPSKIIGISEDLSPISFASDIAEKSKLLTKTEIHFYTCNFLDDICLKKVLKRENVEDKFNFILISKTLHHLRNGKCITGRRGAKHRCREDEKCCI